MGGRGNRFHYHEPMFLLHRTCPADLYVNKLPTDYSLTCPQQSRLTFGHWFAAMGSVLGAWLALSAPPAFAQLKAQPPSGHAASGVRLHTAASQAEILYLALLAEMQLRSDEAGAAYSLMLEAARKSDDPALFRRAMNIALQSRSGAAAIDAAQAWTVALPQSAEPHKLMLQLQINMGRMEDSAISLANVLDLTPPAERSELLDLLGQVFARAKDKQQAATIVAAKLRPWLADATTASSAYTALARVQASADMTLPARASLAEALKATPTTPAAGTLAADWLDEAHPTDENVLRQYIERNPDLHDVRMAYARYLLQANRWQDSETQLTTLTTDPKAKLPEAWLILGALQLQLNRTTEAETSLKTFLSQISGMGSEELTAAHARGKTQAYLSLAHIAERAQRLDEARAWLDLMDTAEDALRIQVLRASLLAREGKLAEARALIQSTPESRHGDAVAKLKAEAQLLREAGQTADAYNILTEAGKRVPDDHDLAYERAMLAEKLGHTQEMERLLRGIIAAQPDNHNALNALGYSLADRNERLPEAKALIEKALSLAPDDPFITDSLGWVLFRMGRTAEAVVHLKKAYEARPDVEIAVHLGEVLWVLGEKQAALTYLRKAHNLQPDSELLKSTLQRLQIKL